LYSLYRKSVEELHGINAAGQIYILINFIALSIILVYANIDRGKIYAEKKALDRLSE
jgi:hypothetical protein